MGKLVARILAVIIFVAVLLGGYFASVRVYQHFHRVAPTPSAPRPEVTITIIPGWNLRQVADYLVVQGFASSSDDVYKVTGIPALDYRTLNRGFDEHEMLQSDLALDQAKPSYVSYEGYLAPETYRVFADAKLPDIITKLLTERNNQFTDELLVEAQKSKHNLHEILTLASIVEEEARTPADRRIVADIMWRRIKQGIALQVDSSVHYAVDKIGDVFTTDKERANVSPWNTYKYPGLPLGPICNPSLDSINAVLNPTPNNYWYFLSGRDGTMHYGKTLDEHNANKKYL